MNTDQLVLTGKFLGAKKVETFGERGFTVRKFYIDTTTHPDYPNTPELQLTGDKVNLVDNLVQGQIIQVKFNLSGKKYTSKTTQKEGVINSISVWKIDVVQMTSAAVAPASVRPASAAPAGPAELAGGTATPAMGMASVPFANADDDFNDLPF